MIVSHQKHISAEALKKRYCHICGEKLDKNPTTKTLSPKDKEEWSKYERMGHSHVLPVGDIKVTEFLTFICPKCGSEISIYKAVIALIQKKLNKNVLSDEELSSNLFWANKKYEKSKKTKKIIFFVFFALIAISLLCLIMLFGNLSFELKI